MCRIFYVVCFIAFHSTVLRTLKQRALKPLLEKEKMLISSIFSFSNNVFQPLKERNHHFRNIKFVICKCFQSGQGQNFVVW